MQISGLAWLELSQLVQMGRDLRAEIGTIIDVMKDQSKNVVEENIAYRRSSLRDNMKVFLNDIYTHKRTPATHILVVLISPEGCSMKPLCSSSSMYSRGDTR